MSSGIVGLIEAEGGRVTFSRFMELALTHPVFGYYSRIDRLLGRGGDFSTAPALSPFFNRTVARLVTELVDAAIAEREAWNATDLSASTARASALTMTVPGEALPGSVSSDVAGGRLGVIELGGGEGQLAQGILNFWQSERPEWRERVAYRIVEVGARLKQIQKAALAGPMSSGWQVAWGSDLEEACAGIRPVLILGNEFLDTLPVHQVRVAEGTMYEAYVEAEGPDLVWTWAEVSDAAAREMEFLFGALDPDRLKPLTSDGIVEVCPAVGDLMSLAAGIMPSGSLVTVDYGNWSPGPSDDSDRRSTSGCSGERRSRGRTVRGHFKHQPVHDVLARAGSQDLTADVDFYAVDLHGRQEGFETVVFTTLSAFLRGGGAEEELQGLLAGTARFSGIAGDPLEADRQAVVLRSLLDERDLGSAFKLMVQVREEAC